MALFEQKKLWMEVAKLGSDAAHRRIPCTPASGPKEQRGHAPLERKGSLSDLITAERPDTPDALALIAELEAALEPLYPPESHYGLSVERLIAEAVPFFVLRSGGSAAGCGGVKLFGTAYGEIKRR